MSYRIIYPVLSMSTHVLDEEFSLATALKIEVTLEVAVAPK